MSAVMTCRQAAELDHSFDRNGWGSSDVKWLSSGDVSADVLKVRKGELDIIPRRFSSHTGVAVLFPLGTEFNVGYNLVISPSQITPVGKELYNWFDKQTIKPRGSRIVRFYELNIPSANKEVISEKVHPDNAVDLAGIFYLIHCDYEQRRNIALRNYLSADPEKGNIFFCKDSEGDLRTIMVYWSYGIWYIKAFSNDELFAWDVGYRIFLADPEDDNESPLPW